MEKQIKLLENLLVVERKNLKTIADIFVQAWEDPDLWRSSMDEQAVYLREFKEMCDALEFAINNLKAQLK